MTAWSWLALAGVLLLIEAFTPGVAFMWLALSAALTGILLWLQPALAWQMQVLAFAACSVISVAAWHGWRMRSSPKDEGTLNRRATSYLGHEALLVEPTGGGRRGRVRVGDTTWLAEGPSLAAGARVRIVGAQGAVLLVAAVEPSERSPPASESAI